jgi:hypothetical protein
MKPNELSEYIAVKEKQIADLDAQYGDKRPVWIDEQIRMLRFYRDDAQKALDNLTPMATIVRMVGDAKDAFDELPSLMMKDGDYFFFLRGMAILDQIKELAEKLGGSKDGH